jgi:hypothetical protein
VCCVKNTPPADASSLEYATPEMPILIADQWIIEGALCNRERRRFFGLIVHHSARADSWRNPTACLAFAHFVGSIDNDWCHAFGNACPLR